MAESFYVPPLDVLTGAMDGPPAAVAVVSMDAGAPPARDFEAEARRYGWSGPENFKGDPEKFIDAETFVKRAEDYMPIAKATIKKLSQRIDQMERTGKQAAEFFSKAEERAYERAKADIKAEMAAAVESGDAAAAEKAFKKFEDLEKPAPLPDVGAIKPEDAAEALIDWQRDNAWYGTDKLMTQYAELQADKMLNEGMLPGPQHLAAILDKVKAKFPEKFVEKPSDGDPEPRKRSAVDGGNSIPPRRGGRTYNDLPAEAKAICDKWVKNGVIKDREAYVKGFDFEGWNK